MTHNLVGRPTHDVEAATIGLQTGIASREVWVRVGEPPIMLFLEHVIRSTWSWIAAFPENFDEVVALLVGCKPRVLRAFFICNDPTHVFVQPLLVGIRTSVMGLKSFSRGWRTLILSPCGYERDAHKEGQQNYKAIANARYAHEAAPLRFRLRLDDRRLDAGGKVRRLEQRMERSTHPSS